MSHLTTYAKRSWVRHYACAVAATPPPLLQYTVTIAGTGWLLLLNKFLLSMLLLAVAAIAVTPSPLCCNGVPIESPSPSQHPFYFLLVLLVSLFFLFINIWIIILFSFYFYMQWLLRSLCEGCGAGSICIKTHAIGAGSTSEGEVLGATIPRAMARSPNQNGMCAIIAKCDQPGRYCCGGSSSGGAGWRQAFIGGWESLLCVKR